jgi:hypothetical protein
MQSREARGLMSELGHRFSAMHAHNEQTGTKWPWVFLIVLLLLGTWEMLRHHPDLQSADTSTSSGDTRGGPK